MIFLILSKELIIDGFAFNDVGGEYEIQEYYTVPHGFASIKHEGILLFIPDNLFNEYFIKKDRYMKYRKEGDTLFLNVIGDLREYEINEIKAKGNTHYVTLELKAVD